MMRRRCSIIVLGLLGTLPCSAQAAERREAAPADQAMHWAFQPVRRPELPAVRDAAWVQNPIDAFVLAGLEARGLHPNPPATKEQLIRRVFYDLTGLPPAPEEVASFLADPSPMAYEALVDRLLASPGYGESQTRGAIATT
jgi:hypothetical protein